jgi:plasmid stabilization system protein ParE
VIYKVRFAPGVLAQLGEIERYIAQAGSPSTAARYVEEVVDHCESLSLFPLRGNARDDLMPGLRISNFRGRLAIAFKVDARAMTVAILGLFHGGRNFEALLQDD